MQINLTEMLKKVEQIVIEASVIMCESFEIKQKDSAANIVTTADLNLQTFLEDKLCKLLPGSSFLAEEGESTITTSEYVWVVDPIDGTANFARGIEEYAISVALIKNQKAVIGVVYNPVRNKMFCATLGGGAVCNNIPISVSNTEFESGILCTALCTYQKEYAPICMDIIMEAYKNCADVRRFGSCAIELCYLANGSCDLYFEYRIFPWDYAAAYLILREAGGMLYGLNGEELKFNKITPLIGANSKENYEKLQRIVAKHIKELSYKQELF